jgi:hypothetical protein
LRAKFNQILSSKNIFSKKKKKGQEESNSSPLSGAGPNFVAPNTVVEIIKHPIFLCFSPMEKLIWDLITVHPFGLSTNCAPATLLGGGMPNA